MRDAAVSAAMAAITTADAASSKPGPCRRMLGEILDLGCSDDLRGRAHYELAALLLRDPLTSEGTLRFHLRTIRLYAEARRQRVRFSPNVEDVFERLAALLDDPASVPAAAPTAAAA